MSHDPYATTDPLCPDPITPVDHPPRGRHAMLDLAGCPAALLDDSRRLRSLLVQAVEGVGATVLHTVVYPFDPQGVSIVAILAESHASLHTYPEYGVMLVDVFTCGDIIDPTAATTALAATVPHLRALRHLLARG